MKRGRRIWKRLIWPIRLRLRYDAYRLARELANDQVEEAERLYNFAPLAVGREHVKACRAVQSRCYRLTLCAERMLRGQRPFRKSAVGTVRTHQG